MLRLFQRRRPRGVATYTRDLLWPSMGWRRFLRLLWLRVARIQGSPHNIGAGVASGMAIGVTPFFGLQFLLSAALAWLCRGNILAALLGTFVSNPWTYPLFAWWDLWLGETLIGAALREDPLPDLSIRVLLDNPWALLLPMSVGGLVTGVAVWFLSYWPTRYLAAAYHRSRMRRQETPLLARR
jgi:uncharacterized protein